MELQQQLNLGQLKEKLDFTQIPGWFAQKAMAPPYRQELVDEARFDLKKPRIAAVLILIYEENGDLFFPVIHRNTYPGVHSNQIGFPGGKKEASDENLMITAIRESKEEINAEPENVEILGALSELFIPPSNFLVYPFIGIYNGKAEFSPCDHEVKNIIPVSVNDFIKNPRKSSMILQKDGEDVEVPAFELENGIKIWGATAMMLNEFHSFLINSLPLSA